MSDMLNKLCKWRSVLAGWHGGSMGKDAPGCRALRDEADMRLLMLTELNALAGLLIAKGVFTAEEFTRQIDIEAAELDRSYERRFPGFRTTTTGIEIYDSDLANDTTKRLGFPP
jgi:hypothetical protein